MQSAVSVPVYSQPSPAAKLQKPFLRWLVISATNAIDAAPPYDSGVRKPSTRAAPAASSR